MTPWGYKLEFSVYIKGPIPTEDQLGDAVEWLDENLPNTDLIGCYVKVIEAEPHGQGS